MRNLDLNMYMRIYLTMTIHIWKHNQFFFLPGFSVAVALKAALQGQRCWDDPWGLSRWGWQPSILQPSQIMSRGSAKTCTLDTPMTSSRFVTKLFTSTFDANNWSLLFRFQHNCNNFSNHVSNFLCGKQIPQYILDLPEKFLATPLAQMLRPMIEQMTPQNVAGSQSYESTPARTGGAAPSTPSGGPTSAAGGATANAQGSPSK